MNDSLQEIREQVLRLKKDLSSQVFIPAHHYQHREIVECADIVGDSYRLAVDVAERNEQYIIFCGVFFMAEGAALFAKENQKVLMPDPAAGCPMADMITEEQAEEKLRELQAMSQKKVVPVVYMNANAPLKAVCGRHGGSVCTSSNARSVLEYYLAEDAAVFFFPDQHLGQNTALQMGLTDREMQKVSQKRGSKLQENPQARIYLWEGYCPVHQEFSVGHIKNLRQKYDGIRIIVHPEVPSPVAQEADCTGSTEQIYTMIHTAESGSSWAVGTEYHFVSRISEEVLRDGKIVLPLVRSVCEDMGKTRLDTLLHVLQLIQAGDHERIEEYHVTVDERIAGDARKALKKMIEITEEVGKQ